MSLVLSCPRCRNQFKSKRLLALHRSQYENCEIVYGRRVAARTAASDHPVRTSFSTEGDSSGIETENQQADTQLQVAPSTDEYLNSADAAPELDTCHSTPEHWSIHELSRLLANWANGKGSAAADQQQLLNLLHDSRFRIEQVSPDSRAFLPKPWTAEPGWGPRCCSRCCCGNTGIMHSAS